VNTGSLCPAARTRSHAAHGNPRLTALANKRRDPTSVLLIGSERITGQPEVEPEGAHGRNHQDGKDGAVAGEETTVGGSALLQKDFHDTLRRVAIPEFRTSSLLTVAVQYLARFGLNLLEVLTDNMIRTSCDSYRMLADSSQLGFIYRRCGKPRCGGARKKAPMGYIRTWQPSFKRLEKKKRDVHYSVRLAQK
jgi:hypothetical protein